MSEQTRKKIIFIALPLAILWAVYSYQPKHKDVVDSSNTMTEEPLDGSPVMHKIPRKMINIEEYEKKPWGKDPFYIPAKKQIIKAEPINWVLSGIIYSSDNPLAIINKKTVRTGDLIDQAKVVKIDRKKVVLDHEGSQITLTVTKG